MSHAADSGDLGSRMLKQGFTLENKSSLPTVEVRAVLGEVTRGLDTELVHVIVKNRPRSRKEFVIRDPSDGLPTFMPGKSMFWFGYYLNMERFREEYPDADIAGWRDRPPANAIAMIVLYAGKDGDDEQRLGWLTRVARHEFTHHYQHLQGRGGRTPGKYLQAPNEIEARAAEVGELPWQKHK